MDNAFFSRVGNYAGKMRDGLLASPAPRRPGPAQVAVTLVKLLPLLCVTSELFEPAQQASRERLHQAVDTPNPALGHGSVYFGAAFGATDYAPMRISYPCIPDPNAEEIDLTRACGLRPDSTAKANSKA